jgi:hypothetical protein
VPELSNVKVADLDKGQMLKLQKAKDARERKKRRAEVALPVNLRKKLRNSCYHVLRATIAGKILNQVTGKDVAQLLRAQDAQQAFLDFVQG